MFSGLATRLVISSVFFPYLVPFTLQKSTAASFTDLLATNSTPIIVSLMTNKQVSVRDLFLSYLLRCQSLQVKTTDGQKICISKIKIN